MVDLEALRLLAAVAECGSLQGAARAAGVSRTTLRRRVEALEAHLGLPLIEPAQQGAVLTRAGALLVRRGRAVLDGARRLTAEVSALRTAPRGLLRAVVPSSVPADAIALGLDMVSAAHPEVRLSLTQHDRPLDHLDDPFDLMLFFGAPPAEARGYTRVLRRIPVGWLATPAYLAAHGAPTSPAELHAHRRFVFEVAAEACAAQEDRWLPTLADHAHVRTHSDALVRTMVARGAGIGLSLVGQLPADALPPDAVHVLPDAFQATLPLCLLTPRPNRLDPVAAAVVDHLNDLLDTAFHADPPA